jgi:hypothetical protein
VSLFVWPLWAIPGALVGLALSYTYGARREQAGSDG